MQLAPIGLWLIYDSDKRVFEIKTETNTLLYEYVVVVLYGFI